MKIKMKCDAHHRINSGRSQLFREGREYNVPRQTGEALVSRNVAEAVPGKTTVEKE